MKRTTVFIGAAVIVITAINFGIVSARRANPPAATVASAADRGGIVAAGPGRVEAVSEEVRVSAQVGGRLQAVLVEENDRVTAGQVLAKAPEHPANVFVETRLDDLRGPHIFLLVRIPSLGNLISQCGDLAGDLIKRARTAVNIAKVRLNFDR